MKLVKVDLQSNLVSSISSSLEFDIKDATNLIGVIETFITEINSGNNLSGKVYTEVAKKLSDLNIILKKRETVASALIPAISNSINLMKAYIGDDDCVDQSRRDDLDSLRTLTKDEISSISADLKEATTAELYAELSNDLGVARGLLQSLNDQIDKIDGLATADSSAYDYFETFNSELSEYVSLVNSYQEFKVD